LFDAVKPCKLGGEITSVREGYIMVATHLGMSDQTSTNIARDGAPKKTQTNFPVKEGMKNQVTALSGVSPANPGVGPDADPANPLSPSAKLKKFPDAPTAWGMKDAHGQSANGDIGHKVLAEAANLGR
jgi:hypothetical protein